MNILITGAGSYVGTCVQNYLLNKHKDWKIDAVDTMVDAEFLLAKRQYIVATGRVRGADCPTGTVK